jgi:HlyD family secretion protein
MKFKSRILALIGKKNAKYIIGGFVLLLVLWWILKPEAQLVETAVVEKGQFQQFILEEGITRVINKFTVFSPVDGILRRIEKSPGMKVSKGELLAIIDQDIVRYIRSPITGAILFLHRESAGPVAMGTPLLDVGDTRKMEVVANVLTSEIPKLKVGNTVEISGWGKDLILGRIKRIEPAAFTKISSLGVEEQRVRVLIDFLPPEGMGEGFQVECKIISFQKEDQILVPSSAIFRDGENWATYVIQNKRASLTKIKIGDQNGTTAMVESGLEVGETVIIYPGEWISNGVKVIQD